MIDVENYVINRVSTMLAKQFPETRVVSARLRTPSEFPCVMIYESANSTFESTRDSDGNERHAEIRYTIDVYTNDRSGKKEKAKSIFKSIDSEMQKIGFFRDSRSYSFDTAETSICIVTAAYRGLVGVGAEENQQILYVYRR